MSTESESSSINCVLCGHAIAPGEPCHAIFTGIFAANQPTTDFDAFDFFNANGDLGLACGCLLRAAERHTAGLPVYSDDRNAMEYAAQCIVGMNKD